MTKMTKNGRKCPKTAKNGQKWPKMAKNGQKWPKLAMGPWFRADRRACFLQESFTLEPWLDAV